MPILSPGFADCSARISLTGMPRPAFVTFGCDPTATDPNQVAIDVYGAMISSGAFLASLDSNATLGPVEVRLGVDGGEPLSGSSVGTSAGLRIADSVSPNVAVLVHKRTARGGRRGRGRMYIPWYAGDSDVNEDGTLISSRLTTIQNAMITWRSAMITALVPLAVLHNTSAPGTEHPTAPGAPDLVTSLVCDPLIATQRRRLGR